MTHLEFLQSVTYNPNMSLDETLNKKVSHPPSLIQVAIKGIWEDSWSIPFEKGEPSSENIDRYLKEGVEGIAFEVFFKTDQGSAIIPGIRLTQGLVTATPREFLRASFRSIWSVKPPTFAAITSALSAALTGEPKSLFSIDPTAIELGVINRWSSLGTLEVWSKSEAKSIDRVVLGKQLESQSHLLKNNDNAMAVEFNYLTCPHHWIAVQVADERDIMWTLNEKRLETLLKDLVQITLS